MRMLQIVARIYGPDEPESLLLQLKSPDWRQRADAAWQLGMHEREDVVLGLIAALGAESENTAVLMQVVASLDRIRDPRAVMPLRELASQDGMGTAWGELVIEAAEVAARRAEVAPKPTGAP
jgi:HEAT repeat protein